MFGSQHMRTVRGKPASAGEENLRTGLGIAALVALLGCALTPLLLPVTIVEGPYIQQPSETSVLLVWYTSRAVEGLTVQIVDLADVVPVRADGRRCVARLDGLQPGQEYTYRVLDGHRVLAEKVMHTNKPPGSAFHFVVFGDSGSGTTAQYDLARQITMLQPDFALHTGDLIYSAGQRERYRARFFRMYADLISRVAFWPCLGNHDLKAPYYGAAYYAVFDLPLNGPPEAMPERHYWFDYADARVAVIDSNVGAERLADHVAPWLQQVMSEPQVHWRFVALHHPPYSVGRHGSSADVRNALAPTFEAIGVDVVFSGHDHLYQRTHPIRNGAVTRPGTGVVYVVTGAGGAYLYTAAAPQDRPEWVATLNNQVHSFTHVVIEGNTLRLEQIDRYGQVLDAWTMEKAE